MTDAVRMVRGDGGPTVEVVWRRRRGTAAVYYAIPFALVLLWLAATSMMFEAVHRTIMGSFSVIIAYFVTVHLTNATRLSVRDGQLVVEHGPLPWRSATRVPLDLIGTLSVDRPSRKLRLRTKRGEELDLLDGIQPHASDDLDAAIRELGLAG